ncbi:MAG: hypothetical protein FWG79_02805, partial [Bacteroidales bacterium]|nr:hypothetical protein [Bacteroidales bacterium]
YLRFPILRHWEPGSGEAIYLLLWIASGVALAMTFLSETGHAPSLLFTNHYSLFTLGRGMPRPYTPNFFLKISNKKTHHLFRVMGFLINSQMLLIPIS